MRILILLLLANNAYAQTSEVINPDVRQDTIQSTICVPGYTKTARPSSSYTNGIKKRLLRERGLDYEAHKANYELDHIINLSVGGHPRNPKNLMLQPWNGQHGARKKDKLEVRLQKMVCRGQITLKEAQSCIWNDWVACSKTAVLKKRY